MKKFNITVNGNSYIVEVEEIKEGKTIKNTSPESQMPQSSSTSPSPKPSAALPASSVVPGGVKAPMPGTINDVKVIQGQSVKSGQVLLILEAMKMENEIMSPKDGIVKSVYTSKGSSVNTGDVLIVIE